MQKVLEALKNYDKASRAGKAAFAKGDDDFLARGVETHAAKLHLAECMAESSALEVIDAFYFFFKNR